MDISKKQCTTVWGSDGEVTLNEPGGLSVDSKQGLAYIADTNKHSIRILRIQDKVMSQVHRNLISDSLGEKRESKLF